MHLHEKIATFEVEDGACEVVSGVGCGAVWGAAASSPPSSETSAVASALGRRAVAWEGRGEDPAAPCAIGVVALTGSAGALEATGRGCGVARLLGVVEAVPGPKGAAFGDAVTLPPKPPIGDSW